jgi:hypothetical protein
VRDFGPVYSYFVKVDGVEHLNIMTSLTAAAPAPNPTFISQYGPLIAALIALFGVVITLAVSAGRDRARYRSQREDDYRRDQRIAIAAIAVAGQSFRKECAALIDPDYRIHHGRHLADPAMSTLLNELTVARLLIYDPILQAGLDEVNNAWNAMAEALDEMENAFTEQELREKFGRSLLEALRKFDAASNILYTAAMQKLRPTVVEIR